MATTWSTESRSIGPESPAAGAAARLARLGGLLLLAIFLLLPVGAFVRAPEVPWAAALAVAGLFCVTLIRPANGLLICAGLLVLAGPLGIVLRCDVNMLEPLLLAFLGGFVLRDAAARRPGAGRAARSLMTSALLLAAVVAASVLVQLGVQQVFVDYPWPFARRVLAYLATDYIVSHTELPGIASGAMMLEGIGLFVATVVLARRNGPLACRVVAMAAAGATGVAALNLQRFAEVCLRSGAPWQALKANIVSLRVIAAFPDPNAVGSYFVMMLFLSLGLAVGTRRLRPAWLVSTALILLALWTTGSRTAMLAVPVGLLVLAWRRTARWRAASPRAAPVAIAVGVSLMLAGAWLVPTLRSGRSPFALQARVEMGRAALRMFSTRPIFGVGIGRFWQLSEPYIVPAFQQRLREDRGMIGPAKENAHNNYLQVLAELGLAGFLPFLAVIGITLWKLRVALRMRDSVVAGAAAGLVAFLVTCLAGHPLLISEVSSAFWLMLGTVVGLSITDDLPDDSRDLVRPRARRLILAVVLVCLAVSVPARARQLLNTEPNLDDAGVGFSRWVRDRDGVRVRTFIGRAELYLASNACDLRLPLRADASGEAMDVEILVDGHPANTVRAYRDTWNEIHMVLPRRADGHYRLIELRAPRPDARVTVGRAKLGSCNP